MPPKPTTRASQTAVPDFTAEPPFMGPALFMARLQASAAKAALKWQIESLGFLKHRYEQDLKFINELLDTPEPGEMLSACSCFMQNALDEYSKETVKATNFGSRIVTDTAREIRSEAEKVSEAAMMATIA